MSRRRIEEGEGEEVLNTCVLVGLAQGLQALALCCPRLAVLPLRVDHPRDLELRLGGSLSHRCAAIALDVLAFLAVAVLAVRLLG
eukprot:3439562-Pyramimonas_sp.AAC.1